MSQTDRIPKAKFSAAFSLQMAEKRMLDRHIHILSRNYSLLEETIFEPVVDVVRKPSENM